MYYGVRVCGATIGANTTIICGVTIGKYSIIGAGSVVTRNIPDFSLVYGVPAKHMGWVCQCGKKLHFKNIYASCLHCNSKYELINNSRVRERV